MFHSFISLSVLTTEDYKLFLICSGTFQPVCPCLKVIVKLILFPYRTNGYSVPGARLGMSNQTGPLIVPGKKIHHFPLTHGVQARDHSFR